MHNGPYQEGRAAAILGSRIERNPYRAYISAMHRNKGRDAESVVYEYASDWDSGFIANQKCVA